MPSQPKPKKGRRAQQKAETRKLLIDVARRLFMERGFEETTTRSIAEEAGVASGTIFVHFPDKASLLTAVLYEEIEETMKLATETLPEEADAQTKIVHIVRHLFTNYAKHPALSMQLVKNSMFMEGEWDENLRVQIFAFFQQLQGFLEAGQTQGTIRKDLDLSMASYGIWANYQLSLLAALHTGFADLDTHIGFFASLLKLSFEGMLNHNPSST